MININKVPICYFFKTFAPENQGAVKLPSYNLFDAGLTYRINFRETGNALKFRLNANNLFDTVYIAESKHQYSRFNQRIGELQRRKQNELRVVWFRKNLEPQCQFYLLITFISLLANGFGLLAFND